MKIALMTSGGDVPGLNAAIRAVVRAATHYQIPIIGIQRGYEGCIDGDFVELNAGSVSHIINKGGTILHSSRSPRFTTDEGRKVAYAQLKKHHIKGLVLIGGDGSMRGAQAIAKESGIPVVGIPKTIDNDIVGTDKAIGFDTAINTAMEAIDKIKDTAQSHNRLFFIEVMGRHAGYIAMEAGMATGAESILVPETHDDLQLLYNVIDKKKKPDQSSYIVVVAEGDESGGAYKLAEQVQKRYPNLYVGVTVLGHIQRGGTPTCADRNLATKLGVAAVQALKEGIHNVMVGELNGKIAYTPLADVSSRTVQLDDKMFELLKILTN
jgi:6-phosphofructokinase 1